MTNNLIWPEMTWERFQLLSLYLIQGIYKNLLLEEYLKRGNKQDGIDLISTNQLNGYTAIQCKHTKSLGVSDLNKIQKEFESGEFSSKTSLFIVTTSADLQSQTLQGHIEKQKEVFKEKRIAYEVWDRNYFDIQLRNHFTLVASFFGRRAAEVHCLIPGSNTPIFQSLESYIPRTVFRVDAFSRESTLHWDYKRHNSTTLTDVFLKNRLCSNRICLIGDPYQGKSYLLKQTAYELTQGDIPYRPIWIELKGYVIKPIVEILETEVGTWEDTPAMDIVVILDGLDEVRTDRFDEAVRYIKEFSKRYPNVAIVFSCRKLFYNHYRIDNLLPNFDTYELYEMTELSVERFLKGRLSVSYPRFILEIERLKLKPFLHDPFYLSQFIHAFSTPPHKIPHSRLEAIDLFIKRSIEKSSDRQIGNGRFFREQEREYKLTMHKFAFSLQVMGMNALEEASMQVLFSPNERDALKHSAIVTVSQDSWSFTSALFQEFLTARILLEMDPSDVIDLVTVGSEIRKIRPKWLQTYATLLGFTLSGSDKEGKYLEILENDSIELVFQMERSKYTDEFRHSAIKKLITKCEKKKIRTIVVYEDTIGDFIGASKSSIDFLIDFLNDNNNSFIAKITSCKILLNCELTEQAIRRLENTAAEQLRYTTNVDYATGCVELLSFCGCNQTDLIEEIINRTDLGSHHIFRNAVYRLIIHAKKTNPYYFYGLEGLHFLIEYNKEISHSYSERSLLDFLLDSPDFENLKAFYALIGSESWQKQIDRRSFSGKHRYFERLSEKTAEIFRKHPEIILTVIAHIRAINRFGLREEFFELDHFFEITNTHIIFVGMMYKEMLGHQGWQYGGFLTQSTIPYFLFEFEEGNYKPSDLWYGVAALEQLPHKEHVAQELREIAISLRDLELPDQNQKKWEEDRLHQITIKKNDLKYIKSEKAFIAAVKAIFEASNTDELSEDDLFVDFEDRSAVRRQIASNFLFRFLICFAQSKKTLLKKCIDFLSKPGNFEYFRVKELLHYDLLDLSDPIVIAAKEILETYFIDNVEKVKFENTYVDMPGNNCNFRRKEVLLGQIYEKLKNNVPFNILTKLIWLDAGGVRPLLSDLNPNSHSISELIIEKLNDTERLIFREEILSNMKGEITSKDVFGTHVSLCVYFNISEAIGIILDHIYKLNDDGDHWNKLRYVDSYIKLGGDPENLKELFVFNFGIDNYHFFNTADHLVTTDPFFVETKLVEYLRQSEANNEGKIEAALRLINLGNIDGLTFLVSSMRNTRISPTDSPDRYTIDKIDTSEALKVISQVRDLILIHDNQGHFLDSVRRTLVEWLYQLARKGEADLKQVIDFFQQAEEDFSEHQNVSDFAFYSEQCKEKFKETGRYPDDVKSIMPLIEKVVALL
ncbi:MAG TPA: hypothetical protein VL098_08395 [Flavipsychrobacter sp.]|nr:hypothetical protein [Flavipsychrobacter sp.]